MLSAYMGDGFFNFDVNGVKRELEDHPWVSVAAVKRVWPDSLSLLLTEEVAIARWGDGQLLNQQGEIFQPSNVTSLTALPRLTGPVESQFEVMQQFQLLSQILFPAGLRLNALALSNRGSWDLILAEDIEVAVGRDDVISKLKRFVEFYQSQPAAQTAQFRTVDLRYSNGIAVKTIEQDLAGVAVR